MNSGEISREAVGEVSQRERGGLPHPDCRRFVGSRPCEKGRTCWDCTGSEAQGARVLVIKVGAMGDVLRTTPILPALWKKFHSCHITWVTGEESLPLLENNPRIARALPFSLETVLRLEAERFDQIYCLDKEPRSTGLAMKLEAGEKRGFGLNRWGNLIALNPEWEYALRLGVDDELKFFKNQKTYQEIVFHGLSLPLPYGPYLYFPREEEIAYGRKVVEGGGFSGERVIGLNTGCGPVYAAKAWTVEGFAALAEHIGSRLGLNVLLLGGSDETDRNREIEERAKGFARNAGNLHRLRNFAGILAACRLVVTGDTIALHLALAVKTPVVAIFGATCPQEIDLYGLGEKMVSRTDCSPCYQKECIKEQSCMDQLSPQTVFGAVERVLACEGRVNPARPC